MSSLPGEQHAVATRKNVYEVGGRTFLGCPPRPPRVDGIARPLIGEPEAKGAAVPEHTGAGPLDSSGSR